MPEELDRYRTAEQVSGSPPRFSYVPHQSVQPASVTVTKEAKQRAARRARYACMPFAILCVFAVITAQNLGLLLVFMPLVALVELSAWVLFRRIERIAAERRAGLW